MYKQLSQQRYSYIQDSEGECASIQKAFLGEDSLQKIISQNRLKKKALEKAQSLIYALSIQVDCLKRQKLQLKIIHDEQLAKIKKLFHKNQSFLNQTIQNLKYKLKSKQKQNKSNANDFSNSKEKKSYPKQLKSEYFSRQFTSDKKKIQMVNMNMNKVLQKTRLQENNQNNKYTNPQSYELYFALLMQESQMNSNNYLQSQYEYYEQQNILEQFKQSYQERIKDAQDMNNNRHEQYLKTTKKQKRKFFNLNSPQKLQKNWKDQIKQQYNVFSGIIKNYTQLLQQYKQYSAYLKAYLCSCLNFINKMTETFNIQNVELFNEQSSLSQKQQFQKNHLPEGCQQSILSTSRTQNYILKIPDLRLSNVITKSVLNIFQRQANQLYNKIKGLSKQNKQLKTILDELIQNLNYKSFKNVNQTGCSFIKLKEGRNSKNIITLTQQNQDQ